MSTPRGVFVLQKLKSCCIIKKMEKKPKRIQVIREIQDEDRIVKEALEITERFKVLPYPVTYEILKKKMSKTTAGSNQ